MVKLGTMCISFVPSETSSTIPLVSGTFSFEEAEKPAACQLVADLPISFSGGQG